MTANPYEAPRTDVASLEVEEEVERQVLKEAAFTDFWVDASGLCLVGMTNAIYARIGHSTSAMTLVIMFAFVALAIHGALLALFGRSVGGWRKGVVQRGPLLGRMLSVVIRCVFDLGWFIVSIFVGAALLIALLYIANADGARVQDGVWNMGIASVFSLFSLPFVARTIVGSRWHARVRRLLRIRNISVES